MLKQWAEAWASFPPLHKKRFYQGLAAYALLVLFMGLWVWSQAEEARKDWLARKPHAEAPVKTVYLTPQLTETSATFDFGSGAEGTPARDARGYVSVIISEAGLTASLTKRALEDLPPEVTLAFSPYSPDLKSWIADAKSENREALVLLPMEPVTYPKDDPGPKALLTRLSDRENANNLAEILAAAEGSVGVMNFMGSRFMQDAGKLDTVIATLRKNGALFVESPSEIQTLASTLAPRAELPYLSADIEIDAKATDYDVRQQLLTLEKLALEKGYAIGIAQPYPVTFNLLKSWAENLEGRGVKLVPLKTMWQVKQQRDRKTQEEQAPEPAPAPEQQPDNGEKLEP